jgi:hypothetical protein
MREFIKFSRNSSAEFEKLRADARQASAGFEAKKELQFQCSMFMFAVTAVLIVGCASPSLTGHLTAQLAAKLPA